MCLKRSPNKFVRGLKDSAPPVEVGPSVIAGDKNEVRLPTALQNLLLGYGAGHGITSPHSPLTRDGVTPDLVPIVVSLSAESGLTTFLTCLATLSALKEVRSEDVILTLSFNLDPQLLTSLLATYPSSGSSDEIPFVISMQSPDANGIFRST